MCKKNRSLILLVQSHLYSAINILRCFQRKQMVHLIAKPPLKLRAGVDCGLTARSRRINQEGCCTRSGRKINGERCGFCKKVLIKPGDAAQMHCWWQKRVGMLAFCLKSPLQHIFKCPKYWHRLHCHSFQFFFCRRGNGRYVCFIWNQPSWSFSMFHLLKRSWTFNGKWQDYLQSWWLPQCFLRWFFIFHISCFIFLSVFVILYYGRFSFFYKHLEKENLAKTLL